MENVNVMDEMVEVTATAATPVVETAVEQAVKTTGGFKSNLKYIGIGAIGGATMVYAAKGAKWAFGKVKGFVDSRKKIQQVVEQEVVTDIPEITEFEEVKEETSAEK